jgi:hypothetical protein
VSGFPDAFDDSAGQVAELRRCGHFIMKRIAAFSLATWSAAAILYFGQHSVALIALSGVVVLGGFDLLRP